MCSCTLHLKYPTRYIPDDRCWFLCAPTWLCICIYIIPPFLELPRCFVIRTRGKASSLGHLCLCLFYDSLKKALFASSENEIEVSRMGR